MSAEPERTPARIASDLETKLSTIRYLATAVRMMGHIEEAAEINPDALVGLGRAIENAVEEVEEDRLVVWRYLLDREREAAQP